MTIEATLERIATALEALVDNQGLVRMIVDEPQQQLPLEPAPKRKAKSLNAEPPVKIGDEDEDLSDFDDDDLEDDLAVEDEPAPAPKPKKKAGKKKAAKKKAVGKKKVESEFSEDDVREKLKELQISSGDARLPKSILKRNGASTLKQLDEHKRGQVIAEIDAELDQYE